VGFDADRLRISVIFASILDTQQDAAPWPGLFMKSLAPLLDPCPHREFFFLGNTARIPLGRKIPCADNALRNHRGDS